MFRGDELGILKTIWTKNETGGWIIHDCASINLNPRDGCSPNFFKSKMKWFY